MANPTTLLTYCGNVHPAVDVERWLASTGWYAPPVAAAARDAGRAFGLGTWWNAATAAQLAGDPEVLSRVKELLAGSGLPIWTLNAFPAGAFHGTRVKEAVYQPDWTSEARLLYTRHVAEAAARLGSDLDLVPISTLPLGAAADGGDLRVMARNLVRAASHLAAMEEEHGLRMVLCLEPEPFCRLETVAQAIEFLQDWVFCPGSFAVSEETLRRHLGVCVDLCHLAVVREDAVKAILDLQSAGIECGKIQVSTCLEMRDPTALDELLAYDEPTYLHQSVAANGARALDLPELGARRAEFASAGVIRTHFHTPVFWDSEGGLGTTRDELERVLADLPRPLPLLEVETYTWDVLPGAPRAGLLQGLLAEMSYVAGLLCD